MIILMPNHAIFNNDWQFENLVFAIMTIEEIVRLISRAPLANEIFVYNYSVDFFR